MAAWWTVSSASFHPEISSGSSEGSPHVLRAWIAVRRTDGDSSCKAKTRVRAGSSDALCPDLTHADRVWTALALTPLSGSRRFRLSPGSASGSCWNANAVVAALRMRMFR